MIKASIQARLQIVCVAFLVLSGIALPATQAWAGQDVVNLNCRIEDQETRAHQGGQLVQTKKLSSDLRTIQLELTNNTFCELSLHDLEGNLIQTIEAEQKKKGKHLVLWKHTGVAAGTYLLTMRTDNDSEQIEVQLE